MASNGGITPTVEQSRIVAAASALDRGDSLKVVAYAGAAKTSTCVLIAAANPSRRYYYGAFNAKIAREASGRFPANVTSSTVHAIARRSLDLPTSRIDKRRLNGIVVGEFVKALALGSMTGRMRLLVARTLGAFVISADRVVGTSHVWSAASTMALSVTSPDGGQIERQTIACCEQIWKRYLDWRNNEVLVPHDVYLKLFECDDALVRAAFGGFHTAFLDEAQDANPVMRSIFELCGCAIVAVGDPMQSIYLFRGARNALALLPGETFELSQSFRFGETIAGAAWAVLQSLPEGAPTVRLRGNGDGGKVVFDRPCRVTLCRTNAGVVRRALLAAGANRSVHVIGGVEELIREIKSAVALYQNRPHEVVADSMRGFQTWAEFKAYAEESMDVGFERLIAMVASGEAANVGLLESRCVENEASADVVVGTAHKAKGLEWDDVALSDDFPDKATLVRRWEKVTAPGARDEEAAQSVLQEWHLVYVALTRAKLVVSLAGPLRDFLYGMEILRPIAMPAAVPVVGDVAVAPSSTASVPAASVCETFGGFGRAPQPRIGFVSRQDLAPHEVDRHLSAMKALGCVVSFTADRFAVASERRAQLSGHVLVVPSLVPHLGRDMAEVVRSAALCRSFGMGIASLAEGFEIHASEIEGFPPFVAASRAAVTVQRIREVVSRPLAPPVSLAAGEAVVVSLQGPSSPYTRSVAGFA